jgi:hypothetical protein
MFATFDNGRTWLSFADHLEIPPNKCVCIVTELTIGFEVLDNMVRSKVVESSQVIISQPNLAKQWDFALLHAQIEVLVDE